MNRTLHKIQGSKFKSLSKIESVIQKVASLDDCVWVEPFFGSGSVGLNLAPKNAHFFDINPYMILLYESIKNGELTEKAFLKELHAHAKAFKTNGADHYYTLREEFNHSPSPLLFFILNRTGFNGLVRFSKRSSTYNVPYCKNDSKLSLSMIDSLLESFRLIRQKILDNNWTFSVADYKTAIAEYADMPECVFFCDPPYLGRNTQYLTDWSKQDEDALSHLLASVKGQFFLTTWLGKCEASDNPYNGYLDISNPPKDIVIENEAILSNWQSFKHFVHQTNFIVSGNKNRPLVLETIIHS